MKLRILMAAILLLILGSFAAQAQEPLEGLRARMKERYALLQELKAKGRIGETREGWIEAVNEENANDEALKKIIGDENADREKLYQIMAQRTETTPKAVGEQNALRIFQKAGPDEFFKGADGKWRAKKLVEVKKPEPKS